MKFTTRLGWHGRIRVVTYDLDGDVTGIEEFNNIITDDGLDLLVGGLGSSAVDAVNILYLAWGNDNTTPVAADSVLGNEVGRKQVTTGDPGTTGVWVTTTYLAPADAVTQIEELGWFAGPTATATVDTGVLLARVLYSRNKSNIESIQVERTDTLARGA